MAIVALASETLSRAAGQLFDILAEGLGTELQSLHHGQVREQLVRQLLDGHAVANRQRGVFLDEGAGRQVD